MALPQTIPTFSGLSDLSLCFLIVVLVSDLSLCFLTCYFVFKFVIVFSDFIMFSDFCFVLICICVCNLFCFQNPDLFCTSRPPYLTLPLKQNIF